MSAVGLDNVLLLYLERNQVDWEGRSAYQEVSLWSDQFLTTQVLHKARHVLKVYIWNTPWVQYQAYFWLIREGQVHWSVPYISAIWWTSKDKVVYYIVAIFMFKLFSCLGKICTMCKPFPCLLSFMLLNSLTMYTEHASWWHCFKLTCVVFSIN